jgi:hypothetical protein
MFRRLALGAFAIALACGTTRAPTPDASAPVACPPCVIDSDCANGGVCSQLGGDSYCAMPCPNGDECTSTEECTTVSTISGDQADVCVDPSSTTCGPPPPSQPDAGACPGFADPTTTATCTSCTPKTKTNCQPNGCYSGWYCNLQTNACQAPPTNCTSAPEAGPPPTILDASVTSTVGADGGTESQLYFAVVGDTRPATEDDTAHYPTAIIGTIFSDLAGATPAPPFVISTGDYQFSNPTGSQAAAQLGLYLAARGTYAGVQFPAMGNHECTGATASNCGNGNADGLTNNFNQFMSLMMAPLGLASPYYVVNVSAPDSSWTAKFVFVAANAWDDTQSAWLDAALSVTTTYTFVVRHESASANTAPGVTPSEAIMANHPYTLSIVGHSHEYQHTTFRPREVIIGNGGAPLAGNQDYGYGVVTQRADGSLQVDMYDYISNAPDVLFRFAVAADGTLVQ